LQVLYWQPVVEQVPRSVAPDSVAPVVLHSVVAAAVAREPAPMDLEAAAFSVVAQAVQEGELMALEPAAALRLIPVSGAVATSRSPPEVYSDKSLQLMRKTAQSH
jgi:hypothetical protein